LANPEQGWVELLRLPSDVFFRGKPVLTGGGTDILLQVVQEAANRPWGLIHHRIGDPPTEYRTLLEAADLEDGSRGLSQMALSPDGTTVIAVIGIASGSAERQILSVPLAGERVITELVPFRDEAQDLTLRTTLSSVPSQQRVGLGRLGLGQARSIIPGGRRSMSWLRPSGRRWMSKAS
jgi:hypothetical protein